MKAIPAVRAARGGLSGRRVQAMVIGLVLLVSTGASTLALGLLVDSNAPFDHAFAAQHGSEVTATARAATAQLAAIAQLPGVTAAAGPFPETTIAADVPFTPPPGQGGPGVFRTQLTVVGRPSPGGPVDDLTLRSGHWPTQPDQVVLNDVRGPGDKHRDAGHRDRRAGLAEADRGRLRHLDHPDGPGLGAARRGQQRCARRDRRT